MSVLERVAAMKTSSASSIAVKAIGVPIGLLGLI